MTMNLNICEKCKHDSPEIVGECKDCEANSNFEPKKEMTEQEKIQAWKDNKFMAFGGMPIECQEWAQEHCEERAWRIPGAELPHSIFCNPHTIYTLNPGYQPPGPKPIGSDWVELDIEEEHYQTTLDVADKWRHWQDYKLSAFRDNRTLPDGRILTKFSGWWWVKLGCWSDVNRVDSNEIPIKIRFWAERITA